MVILGLQRRDLMATGTTLLGLHTIGAQELKKNWGWFLALGIVMLVLGVIALGAAVATTIVSVMLFGWLLIVGGALSIGHSFWRERGWGGFFIDLLIGILYIVVGFMLVANPAAAAVTLTLLIALFLMFGGLLRIVVALSMRFHHWGWLLLNGVVTLLLGIAIWAQWPLAGLWVIGLFIGIDMIFNGWGLIMLALAARAIPKEAGRTAAAVI
jgi:uncharacterized membrane protein HdeD (DUF308 family)